MSSTARRVLVLVCCALSLSVFGVATASAAGPPKSIALGEEGGGFKLTDFEYLASANPNGASTTAKIEFRRMGTSTWESTPTHSLGSGNTTVSYVEDVRLLPNTKYEVRGSATNSYGTIYTGITSEVISYWRDNAVKTLVNVPYEASGIGRFEWAFAGHTTKIECNEFGRGVLGNPEGKGDSHTIELEGCSFYLDGVKSTECTVKPFSFKLNGGTLAVEGNLISIPLKGEGCLYESYEITADPFRLQITGKAGGFTTNHDVQLSTAAHWLNRPATISLTTNWFLTAEYLGTKFNLVQSW